MHQPSPPDLALWRAAMRSELIARRQAMSAAARQEADLRISLALLRALPQQAAQQAGMVVGFCWPHRGEYDPRPVLDSLRAQGLRNALPVIRREAEPMRFRRWEPGVAMEEGPFGIAMPTGTEEVDPDLLLVPLVGFGDAGDRLGYGGGYFDRTLAARTPQPLAIGVGFEFAHMATTFPRAHDIPMDAVITEEAVRWRESGHLRAVTPAQLRTHLTELAESRRAEVRANATTILRTWE